jgi:RNA polymerase sigma-70 factor (ECF subfamily)
MLAAFSCSATALQDFYFGRSAAWTSRFHRRRRTSDLRIEMVNCNNTPAIFAYRGDHIEGVFLIEITDGKITNFYAVRNPDKLLAVTVPRQVSR